MRVTKGISGFPEFSPEHQRLFGHVCDLLREQCELCGFEPLDTPAVERVETLEAKGVDHEIYGIYRLNEGQKRDLALRFDLTVPLSRYVAQHHGGLIFPWRRYQIAPVWRGERAQSGRYRQFYQCDVDILGDGQLDLSYDAEVLGVASRFFQSLGIDRYVVHINNVKILRALLEGLGIVEETSIRELIQLIDKLHKISREEFVSSLTSKGLSRDSVSWLCSLFFSERTYSDSASYIKDRFQNGNIDAGLLEVDLLLKHLKILGIAGERVRFDPSLARGLNYYTGSVFEIKLTNCESMGSVCGGGRYENLIGHFCNHSVPGVGISFGLSRVMKFMLDNDVIDPGLSKPRVFFASQDTELVDEYISINKKIRDLDISTDLYFGSKSLAAQLRYASKKRFNFVILLNKKDVEENKLILRNMEKGSQIEVNLSCLEKLRALVGC